MIGVIETWVCWGVNHYWTRLIFIHVFANLRNPHNLGFRRYNNQSLNKKAASLPITAVRRMGTMLTPSDEADISDRLWPHKPLGRVPLVPVIAVWPALNRSTCGVCSRIESIGRRWECLVEGCQPEYVELKNRDVSRGSLEDSVTSRDRG